MADSNAETQKEPTQPSPFIDKGFKHEQHQQQQPLQQHRNFRKKHTSQAKTNSEQPGSSNTEVANLQDRPKQRSQSGNTSSRHITEDSTEPECEVNQNSQWRATTTTKRRHGSSKTTRDDYPRKQAFSAPTTSGKSTSSTLRSASSTIGTGHHEHHPRSSYSRTPHSIRPEDERSIPDTISTGNLDKSDSSQPRQDKFLGTRCYRCQQYGHVARDQCTTRQQKCGICSANHETKVCLQKREKGETVEPRCANCQGKHVAASARCPVRQRRVAAMKPKTTTAPRREERLQPQKRRSTTTTVVQETKPHQPQPKQLIQAPKPCQSTSQKPQRPARNIPEIRQETRTTSERHQQTRGNPAQVQPTKPVPIKNSPPKEQESATRVTSNQKGLSSMQVPGPDIQRSSSEQGSQNSSRFSQRHHPDHRGGTQPVTVSDIKLLHFKCQGANNKKPAIEHAVRDENFDIICLQDTRLEPSKENPSRSKFILADFDIYHRPKSENCHGIWTAIRRDFPSENISANFDFGPKRNISAYGYTLSHLRKK